MVALFRVRTAVEIAVEQFLNLISLQYKCSSIVLKNMLSVFVMKMVYMDLSHFHNCTMSCWVMLGRHKFFGFITLPNCVEFTFFTLQNGLPQTSSENVLTTVHWEIFVIEIFLAGPYYNKS